MLRKAQVSSELRRIDDTTKEQRSQQHSAAQKALAEFPALLESRRERCVPRSPVLKSLVPIPDFYTGATYAIWNAVSAKSGRWPVRP